MFGSKNYRRLFDFLFDVKWWFLHRFSSKHKYNILSTGFPPGYYDPCMQIPAAIFKSVEKFVDETAGVIDWKLDQGHIEAWKAFCEASIWWKKNKENVFEVGFDDECFDQNEIEKLLTNVIKNINYMWYM